VSASPDLTGRQFGRLLVLCGLPAIAGRLRVACACECGSIKVIRAENLLGGHTRSCGCRQILRRTHGRSSTALYRVWASMIARCRNPNTESYALYGARGIRVCDRWNRFEAFLADMGERPVGTTLDRIDPNGNYEAGNCRWVTRKEQALNRRNSRGRITALIDTLVVQISTKETIATDVLISLLERLRDDLVGSDASIPSRTRRSRLRTDGTSARPPERSRSSRVARQG